MDREKLAKSLGFAHPLMNSLHAVGDRDLVCDFMYWCNMVMIHLSRICEDLIIYSSKEFGFVSLHDSYRLVVVFGCGQIDAQALGVL